MANMVHEVFGDLLLVLHTEALPSRDEWQSYLNSLGEMSIEVRQLVFTDGGRPNSEQRAALHEVLRDKHNTGSVISSSKIIRHVVAAINWLGPHNVQSFAASELDKALQYIRVTRGEAPQLMTRIAALSTKMDSPLKSLPQQFSRAISVGKSVQKPDRTIH